MHISTESAASGGLTILPEIPDVPAVLVEGRNGIGKTILVRLLELISGKQPFAENKSSWLSLKERLGATTVKLSGLAGGQTVTVRFTPEEWPSDEVPLAIGEWLGEVTIDEQPADVRDAQSLIWVERFAGNEDLDQTLRRRLAIYADRVARTHRRITSTISSLGDALAPIVEQIEPLDPEHLAALEVEINTATEEEAREKAELNAAISRHAKIVEAIESAHRIDAADDPSAKLASRRAELQQQLAAAQAERDAVAKRVDKTSDRLKLDGDAQGALADAQRLHRYRAQRVRNLTSQVANQARRAEIDLEKDDVGLISEVAQEQLASLRAERRSLDSGGRIASLIDGISGLIAASHGDEELRDEALAILEERRYTTDEVARGLDARATELRGRPLPEELEALEAAVNRAQQRASRLRTLLTTLEDLKRVSASLKEAEKAVETAEERAIRAGELDEAFRNDSRRLGQLEEQIDRLGEDLADLYERMGLADGESLEDARVNLSRRLAELEIADAPALAGAEVDAREVIETANAQVVRQAERLANLRRTVTMMRAAIDGTRSTLASDPQWNWLLEDSTGPGTDLKAFASARARLLKLAERLEDADRFLDGFGTVADAALHQGDALIGDAPRVEALRRVLGEELRAFLDTPAIRDALFDGAELREVDPVEAQLTLETPSGPSVRPFDSFSTGEQAFAFTQARISELEPSERQNRLLVLDEFGAFVAADRLPALIAFLSETALGSICDQVVVVLPLQVDYEVDVEFTTGALQQRYRERAAQVAERGYLAVPLIS